MQNSFNFRLIFLSLFILIIGQSGTFGISGSGSSAADRYGQFTFKEAPSKLIGVLGEGIVPVDSLVDKAYPAEISNLRVASSLDDCVEVIELSETEFLYVYSCDGEFAIPEEYDEASVLIVAGGGGGGYGRGAGGGGGGGVVYVPTMDLERGMVYSVTVGRGGQGAANANNRGGNGAISEFNSRVAVGGGGGGSNSNEPGNRRGQNGGSGGGNAANTPDDAPGRPDDPGQGNAGGEGRGNGNGNGNAAVAGGGGGGANGNGNNGQGSSGGNGGEGRSAVILEGLNGIGVDNVFAAGGGGSGSNSGQGNNHGTGGSNKGGNGSNGRGGNGAPNSGSGGGAGWDGGGNGADGIVIIRMSMRILPVQWTYVSCRFNKNKQEVELNWALGQKDVFAVFEIERSLNDVDHYQAVGHLDGGDMSGEDLDFYFLDNQLPAIGGRLYYRIRKINNEGAAFLSQTVAADIPPLEAGGKTWKAYPNPTSGHDFYVKLVDPHNYSGEEVRVKLISSTYGTRKDVVTDEFELNAVLSEMLIQSSQGVYLAEISWGDQVEFIKILKR